MGTVRIRRLDLDVRGLDPGLVRAALELLPDALPEALSGALPADPRTSAGAGPLRFASTPSPAEMARELAARVAREVHRSGGTASTRPLARRDP